MRLHSFRRFAPSVVPPHVAKRFTLCEMSLACIKTRLYKKLDAKIVIRSKHEAINVWGKKPEAAPKFEWSPEHVERYSRSFREGRLKPVGIALAFFPIMTPALGYPQHALGWIGSGELGILSLGWGQLPCYIQFYTKEPDSKRARVHPPDRRKGQFYLSRGEEDRAAGVEVAIHLESKRMRSLLRMINGHQSNEYFPKLYLDLATPEARNDKPGDLPVSHIASLQLKTWPIAIGDVRSHPFGDRLLD